ncbi:FAD binding domain-containing protein [Pseudonocardia acaciae]|uniref:FAD binding domain-containing protein n=1 Tax=Pseudonocardia acaciae TaxID=551276 RepID=UPI000566BA9F|nr:FAD binding domain-containing protein [Pseudonocardia acaciae]
MAAVAAEFEYRRPGTVAALIADMAEPGACALAGGTDLVPLRAAGALAPSVLVDVKHIAELRGVHANNDGIRIGAATTLADLGARVDPALDAVLDGARVVGGAQTRERATLGGNLCRSSPAGDTLCGLLVLDAVAELHSARGTREVAVRDFFTGPGRNVMTPDEILVSVLFPAGRGGSAYRRFTYRRWMDLAVVGVAARLAFSEDTCVDAAVAIGAVAPTPLLVPDAASALVGTACDDAAIARALEPVLATAAPIDDVRGTRAHRLRVLRSLTSDVLRLARARARSRPPAH